MNKKAQITIYIIIGIIILFSIGVSIYVAQKLLAAPPEISPVGRPVKDYVESCIQQVGANALVPIGANGGYMDPSAHGIRAPLVPTEGNGISISPAAKQAIPYWFYMSTQNTCKKCLMQSMQPSLEDIEKEIEQYVDEHLKECIGSFEPFLKQGYEFEAGEVKTDVLLTEASTRFVVNYPVKIKKLDVETRIEDFEATVDVAFKKMYDLAGRITDEEREKAFLESMAFHFISLHTGLDMSKLPPLGAVTHDKVLRQWFKPMVEMNVQQLLLSYIPLIQLAKTSDARQIDIGDNTFEQGFYKALYLRFLEDDYPFKVNFAYLDWPIYFDITPRRGDLLTGTSHVQEFPFNFAPAFQTNYYEFYYDLSAPVLIEIRDPLALKGKGYSFNFALELNVRDNKNFIEWNEGEGTIGFWDPANAEIIEKDIQTTIGSCTEKAGGWYCDINGRTYPEQIQCVQECYSTKTIEKPFKPVKKLFADPEQEVSNMIVFNVLDAVTKEPLPDASILFTCGRYKSIIMGTTDLEGKITRKMPFCINGQLSAEKEGYAKKIIGLTIKPDDKKNKTILLEPEAELTVTVEKYPIQIKNLRTLDYSEEPEATLSSSFEDIDSWESLGMSALGGFKDIIISPLKLEIEWEEEGYLVGREQKEMKIYDRYCCDAPESLSEKQSAILMIEKLPEDPLEPEYFGAVLLEEGQVQGTVKLIPGIYKVNGMLVDADGFNIQAGCQEVCIEYDLGTEYYVGEIGKSLVDVLGGAPEEKPECKTWGFFPEENITAKPSMLGGVMLNNITGYWNVTRAGLNKGSVEFYFIQTLRPTCTLVQDCVLDVCVDIAEIQATEAYSLKYRDYLEPKFAVR